MYAMLQLCSQWIAFCVKLNAFFRFFVAELQDATWSWKTSKSFVPNTRWAAVFNLSCPVSKMIDFFKWSGRLFWVDLIKWVSNVRPGVRPSVLKKFLQFQWNLFGMQVEVDEWCTTVCSMTRSKVKVTSPSKLEILPFSNAIYLPFTMRAGNWPWILKLGHNI